MAKFKLVVKKPAENKIKDDIDIKDASASQNTKPKYKLIIVSEVTKSKAENSLSDNIKITPYDVKDKIDDIEYLIKQVFKVFPNSKIIHDKKTEEIPPKKAKSKSIFKEPSQEVVDKIKAREKEMYEKGWSPHQIWNCDAYWYHEAGLAALMHKEEEIGTITSESIELISYQGNERIVQFFTKRKNSNQREINNNSQSIKER